MYTFLLATTTTYGTQNADSLIAAGFRCLGVITPTPRPVGRHQILTPNPAHLWAEQHNFPLFPVTNKLEKSLQESLPTVDFLLVVDFGYYVPGWLIKHPRLLSVNIHP
ncbi:hypothetical protein IJI99_01410, partial [bacterium]|nr:hypothetical protein [bacterium]